MQKSVIIVGAGQGVGLETARYFGKMGYAVGLIRRGERKLKEIANELAEESIQVYAKTGDASDPEKLGKTIAFLAEKMGQVDVLLYNVPGPLGKAYMPVTDIPTGLLDEFLTLRVTSALASAQAILPYLKDTKGSIMFTSGQSDRTAFPNTAAIGAPQAALRMIAEHLSNELKQDDVFVGYLPLANPPLYANAAEEKLRNDLPEGFHLDERVIASHVAEVIFQLNQTREKFDCPVGPTTS